MKKLPQSVLRTLESLAKNYVLTELAFFEGKIDFNSNDYLGVVTNHFGEEPVSPEIHYLGSKGVRLLSGNYPIHMDFEKWLATYYEAEAAITFSSGYAANSGFLAAVAQRGDTILYDEIIHASMRDGIRLSFADAYSFKHNDIEHLRKRIEKAKGSVFVVIESLYSMDGDIPDLEAICDLCDETGAFLVVDEAHSTGIYGEDGQGLLYERGLHQRAFARIYTFGKGIGRKGAAIVGDKALIQFLTNRCRTFIYSTSLAPMDVHYLWKAMEAVKGMKAERKRWRELSEYANQLFVKIPSVKFIPNDSPLKAIIIGHGNAVDILLKILRSKGMALRLIVSPVVPMGTERLRVVLHSFNTEEEIDALYEILISPLVQNLWKGIKAISLEELSALQEGELDQLLAAQKSAAY